MKAKRIIELLTILTSSPSDSKGFETREGQFERHQQYRHEALRELATMQRDHPLIHRMFESINAEMPSDGGDRDSVLRAAKQRAAVLLPVFQRAQEAESGRTNRERFLGAASNRDPFLGPDVNLTIDSYVGQFEMEADTWTEGVNLERKR